MVIEQKFQSSCILTRPDVAFTVNVVSRFRNNPVQVHWNAVKRNFRYSKSTAANGIEYCLIANHDFHLVGQSDSDFANDVDARK